MCVFMLSYYAVQVQPHKDSGRALLEQAATNLESPLMTLVPQF